MHGFEAVIEVFMKIPVSQDLRLYVQGCW